MIANVTGQVVLKRDDYIHVDETLTTLQGERYTRRVTVWGDFDVAEGAEVAAQGSLSAKSTVYVKDGETVPGKVNLSLNDATVTAVASTETPF